MTPTYKPFQHRATPTTKQIVDELDELVDQFKETLDKLRLLYAEEESGEEENHGKTNGTNGTVT